MKVTVSTENLRESLQKVNLVSRVTRADSLALSNALVNFNGKVSLTTSDLERMIKVDIDSIGIGSSGQALLPRRSVSKFLSGVQGNIDILAEERNTSLSQIGLGEVQMLTPPVKDFPPMPVLPDNLVWTKLDAKWFCSMLKIAEVSCAEEKSRPVLTGIACKDGEVASADGFRLTVIKNNKFTFGLEDKQVIIPCQTSSILRRLFAKEDVLEVAFMGGIDGLGSSVTHRYVHFRAGNAQLISELIQGTFPEFKPLIPDKYDCRVIFDAPLMVQRLNMIDPSNLASGILKLDFHKTGLDEFGLFVPSRNIL